MYTKVTPKAGQNGPMWLYVGSTPTFLDFWLGITYNYFSMMALIVNSFRTTKYVIKNRAAPRPYTSDPLRISRDTND